MATKKAKTPVVPEPVEVSRRVWERWRNARAMKAQWEEVEKQARAALEKEIGAAPGATINGIPVIAWKETEKINSFDMESFKREHPDLHAEYMIKKPGTRPFKETEFDESALEGDE